MADNIVIDETTYNDVEAVSMVDENGNEIMYYPDAVRYNKQTLTEEQKAQARENMGAITEEDVPVKSVNGKTGAVSLNASDVGARPDTWTPSFSDVGADKAGTAQSLVEVHNIGTDVHNDIRLLIQGLAERLNAFANSDDESLDQAKEFAAYIKANRGLIESITTQKINYTDIINNLVTNVANKPLSAAQGVVIKGLINSLHTELGNKFPMVRISTEHMSYMQNIITAIQNAGGSISTINFVAMTGYISGFIAIKFTNYDGTTYRVECVDINNVTKIYNPENNNVIDVSTTRIGDFLSYTVNDGLPTYTEQDNGKFISIIDGEAVWVDLPVAEDIVITIAEEITFNE